MCMCVYDIYMCGMWYTCVMHVYVCLWYVIGVWCVFMHV